MNRKENTASILTTTILVVMVLLPFTEVSGQAASYPAGFISQRFSEYCTAVPWEEVFIRPDRDEYISGEEVWFSAWLIDRQGLKYSKHSKILYIELLDPENRPVIRKKILLENGRAGGSFRLSDTLSSGTYTIRSYTNWMKNFLPYNCFIRNVNIYNSQLSDTFIRKSHDEERKKVNPDLSSSGIAVKVTRMEDGQLSILMEASDDSIKNDASTFCLFLQVHGNILYADNFRFDRGRAEVLIHAQNLKPGICQLAIFNSQFKVTAEKYFYIPPDDDEPELFLNYKDSVGLREKVTLELQTGDLKPGTGHSGLSISVAPATGEDNFPGIGDYLLLGTEFGTDPGHLLKCRNTSGLSAEEWDELLSGLKSRWIRWETILSGRKPELKYLAESDEHFIYGKLMETDGWPALNDEIVLMSIPGKSASFQYAVTDTDGNFSFTLPVDEMVRDLIIQPDNLTKFKKILIRSQFADEPAETKAIVDSSGYNVPAYISKWSLNQRLNSVYGLSYSDEKEAVVTPYKENKRFYGKPGFELIPDNYMKLPTMEEIFFELIPGVRLKRWESVCDLTILDPRGNQLYTDPPGLMVDGVIIKDPGLIADLDPEIVEKIDIVYETYLVDDYAFHGLVNIITRSGDFRSQILPMNSVRMKYRISDPAPSFLAPEYSLPEKKLSRIPDLRNTLFWDPSVEFEQSGRVVLEFWTSDYPADYIISIQGLTEDGKVISVKKDLKVVPDQRP